ncbi:MAG: hypothetical protein ACR2MS_02440 [Weeksellaceae bacterium]
MQINYISHDKIDFKRYDQTIEHSHFPTIYALSWYLDIVTKKNWDVLVYGDYRYVMPVPYARLKRNLMLKTVVQPMFCQQLGVFSSESNQDILLAMVDKLKEKRITSYQLNENLTSLLSNLNLRDNYILDLNQPYKAIYDDYRKDRKKDMRRGLGKNWKIKPIADVDSYMDLLLRHSDYLNATSAQLLKELLQALDKRNLLIGKEIRDNDGHWMAMAYWVKSFNRQILLTSVRHQEYDQRGAFANLIDAFVKDYANQSLILDFEGSMIAGIADFNASFGAEKKQLPII